MNESLREVLGYLYPFFGATGAVFWTALVPYLLYAWVVDFLVKEEQ